MLEAGNSDNHQHYESEVKELTDGGDDLTLPPHSEDSVSNYEALIDEAKWKMKKQSASLPLL